MVMPGFRDHVKQIPEVAGRMGMPYKKFLAKRGDVLPLPFPDASFTIVTSRFAFHHFLDPLAVLREMRRVAAPGGPA